MSTIIEMKERYQLAETAKVGEKINCPCCSTVIVKTTYNKKFCNSICKDGYWNKIDPNRRNRKHPKSHYTKYNVGKKSYEARGWPMGVDEGPEGWDGHKDCKN